MKDKERTKLFVSRAENKLAGATQAFSFDFKGKTVLDIGSSTGGFTEYALSAGAEKVIAIEKGTNQMKAPLRFDPRVELHEKTDIFETTTSGIKPNETCPAGKCVSLNLIPDVVVADVSFVSLKKVLAHAKKCLAGKNTDFLVMLKPQFEAKPEQLNKGVVKNEKMRREIIRGFENWLKANGFLIINKRDNELSGKNGNVERFYLLKSVK